MMIFFSINTIRQVISLFPVPCLLFFLLFLPALLRAQSNDSLYYQLQEVEVTGVSHESLLRLPGSENIINRTDLDKQSSASLLPAVNTIPGVRMEERSPGSYRLSIRGSLLRSPFGVRNVKIYLMDIPFTDAGGNTYINSLDIGAIGSLRILKGPEGSIFGANTGGVLLIDPIFKTSDSIHGSGSVSGGSFGLFHETATFQKRSKTTLFNIAQGYQYSDGYRENSRMRRNYVSASGTWGYHKKAALKLLFLFSDLYYQTPGGLTLQQYTENPRQARPATAFLPGAAEQKASVSNQTFLGGISHDLDLTKNIRHVISFFGSHTDFENPFITNFEQRKELTYGTRTYFDFNAGNREKLFFKWNLGAEWQQTNSLIENFGNNRGNKDSLQVSDNLIAQQGFFFGKFLMDIHHTILTEISGSYNFFNFRFRNNYPVIESDYTRRKFTPAFMPRLAVSWLITPGLSWRTSLSYGYSAPTLAEVRSSTNIVNTSLQAEKGRNLETGIRIKDKAERIWIDITGFHYRLTDAIVRRLDTLGNEYFVNAGNTNQNGLEGELKLWIIKPREQSVLRYLKIGSAVTYNHFIFGMYTVGTADYSGKNITGVPDYTFMENLLIGFPAQFSLYVQYYYSDKIPLTDGNTVYANEYHLVQAKAEWKKNFKDLTIGIFAGADNILNQKYSLGNDLNAIGGRYYNGAPLRNFYLGLKGEF